MGIKRRWKNSIISLILRFLEVPHKKIWVSWGVLYKALGVQKGTQTPCWLRPCAEVIAVRRVWTKSVQVPNLLYFNNVSVGKQKLLIASLVIQGSKLRYFLGVQLHLHKLHKGVVHIKQYIFGLPAEIRSRVQGGFGFGILLFVTFMPNVANSWLASCMWWRKPEYPAKTTA